SLRIATRGGSGETLSIRPERTVGHGAPPGECPEHTAVAEAPQLHSFRAGGGETIAIWAEDHPQSGAGLCSYQAEQFSPGFRVPNLCHSVLAGGSQALTVRAESHTVNPIRATIYS